MRLILFAAASTAFAFQSTDTKEILDRTLDASGFSKTSKRILHWQDMQGIEQNYQSAPPFATVLHAREVWFDPQNGVERSNESIIFPGAGPTKLAGMLYTRRGIFAITDSGPVARSGPLSLRELNLWAVLADWRAAIDVHQIGDQIYANNPRKVLARRGESGEERLFIDPNSGLPVKLDRDESHYLWGRVHVEYVYALWRAKNGAMIPTSAARVVDGFKEVTRTVGNFDWIEPSAAPDLSVPDVAPASLVPMYLQATLPKTINVGPNTLLVTNPGYTEAVTRFGSTIYVLDCTQGEERARQDLAIIRSQFPDVRNIAVVVTDLAWPHIAGIRFWVSQGATIISHRSSKAFLTRVIERRWSAVPDSLEQNRKELNFVAVDKELVLEGGKLRLIPIGGRGSEGALMAFLSENRMLWASDFIQSVTAPATYTTEVVNAVRRARINPETVGGMHIPLTDWSKIESLAP